MFGVREYQKACDRLTLGAETLEEMIEMTENQNKKPMGRPVRVVMVAAALVAALAITAGAAELPIVQQFFATVFVTVKTDDGILAGLAIPSMAVEEREGRTVLLLDEEEIDVTDALAQDGKYLYRGEGYEVQVDADGVAQLIAYDNNGDVVVTFSTEKGAKDEKVLYNVVAEGDGEEKVGVYEVTTGESGSVEITDAEGETRSYQMKDGKLVLGPAE